MLPGNGIGDTDKTCFTTDTQYAFQHTGLETSDIKEYIRNPHKFNIKEEMDGQYYNLWSTDNDKTVPNDDVVIKSVYDPSPVGYSLPASNAFTGFTTTGQNIGNDSTPLTPEIKILLNVKDNWDKGWYFYTKPNRKGNTIFFPYNRSRQYNGEFRGGRGDATTATPSTDKQHYLMTYGPTYIIPLDNYDYRSWGFSVRSAEEKKIISSILSLRWTVDIIICGVRIMIRLMLMMK